MSRPDRLVVVLGTSTEVGKTWVGSQLLRELHGRSASVSARKPLQSFDPAAPGPTDAAVLAEATGESVEDVCPPGHDFGLAMAPPMAAAALGATVPTLARLCRTIRWPDPPVSVGLVETVGGVRSPLAEDGDSLDLARALDPDVTVLVAGAGLGVIDAVRSAGAQIAPLPLVVHLNRFDPDVDLHHRNRDWLRDRDGFDVVTTVVDLADRVAPA